MLSTVYCVQYDRLPQQQLSFLLIMPRGYKVATIKLNTEKRTS